MSYAGDDGPWLTISEAAERAGKKIDAMRALVRRGRMPRKKGNRGEWLVQLPERLMRDTLDTDSGNDLDAALDSALDTELSVLREQVTELRLALARSEGELATGRAVAEANAIAAARLLTEREATILDLRQERDRLLERGLAAWLRRALRIG
jgi:hypothetical protein